MLEAVTGQTVTDPNFDDATLALLDQNQELFSPVELVRLAKILKLNTKGT